MKWKEWIKPIAVQIAGQALMGVLAWYWLNLGVGTITLVGANALIGVLVWIGWSLLLAYGLSAPRQWLWAMPAVALMPLMGLHIGLAILVPFCWLIVLFPTVAAGRWKVQLAPSYLGVCLAILVVMTVVPAVLLNWIPSADGLRNQVISFGLRSVSAFVVFAAGWAILLRYIGRSVTTMQVGASRM